MTLRSIKLPPGQFSNGTELEAQSRYRDGNLVRHSQGRLGPIGGWQRRASNQVPLTGMCRAVLPWMESAPSTTKWIGLGTHTHLFAMAPSGALFNITPFRDTETLGTDPLSVTNGSATVTVTDTAHGAVVGDYVSLSGATASGGISAAALNREHVITAVTTNTYDIVAPETATSTDATAGGASVVASYNIIPGRADATANTGYGSGPYGVGAYGTPRPDLGNRLFASTWALDTWGENLLGCRDDEGSIWEWALNTTSRAAIVANAPTDCDGILVSAERALMAFKGRTVYWSDQEDNTAWTPTLTNQAGDWDLATVGRIMQGIRMRGTHLIVTTVDAWTATYLDPTLVYSFNRVGEGCGLISRKAMVATDSQAAWMGQEGFYVFSGGVVQPVPCDVNDRVFGDLNRNQASKIWAEHRAAFGEVWWHYPSGSTQEIDRYVVWNYREGHWHYGEYVRTAGTDKGVFENPMAVSADGYVFDHELGRNFDGVRPFIETGPVVMGEGDWLYEVQHVIPDENTSGDVEVTVYGREFPNSAWVDEGTYQVDGGKMDLLVQAGQMKVRYTATGTADFRIGNFKIDYIRGDPLI